MAKLGVVLIVSLIVPMATFGGLFRRRHYEDEDTEAAAPVPAPAPNPSPNSEPLAGGESAVNLNDADERSRINHLADVCMSKINSQNNGQYRLSVVSVNSATGQVVAGMIYGIGFTCAESNCPNNQQSRQSSSNSCPPRQGNSRRQTCKCKVFVQPWLKKEEVKEVSCH